MDNQKTFPHEQGHGSEEQMLSQDQWSEVRAMAKAGKRIKQISRDLGVSRNTIRKVLRTQQRSGYQRTRNKPGILDEYFPFLQGRAPEVFYNATTLFQELKARGYKGGYTTVREAVKPLREAFVSAEAASIRFETPPGHQAQMDWGSSWVIIAGQCVRIRIFVMVLCYSRTIYVEFTLDEKLPTLVGCHERAFRWFNGLTEEILYDNPKTIVLDRGTEKARLNSQFEDFCRYYGYKPRLCRPYRARTKGKVESGVKYVKRSFLPGKTFVSLDDINDQVKQWIHMVADQRIHGTVHERPAERFLREKLSPLKNHPAYVVQDCQIRKVASDCLISYEASRYSVPWKYVRQIVDIQEECGLIRIYHRNQLIAQHQRAPRKYQTVIDKEHYLGLFKRPESIIITQAPTADVQVRSLDVYEAIAGGGLHG
ncbi:integrase catalytic core [Lucifera butyrica]|uniref:Integrase catalytic core n=1 Tax=Lucifera butyrica TaxID=1351585 RepID=A0A498RCR5_9FIRM|nr:IS21 family transposase [Lucifera butyrica]VBB09231.1 integrase catalytic core [Lucifera butyrica]